MQATMWGGSGSRRDWPGKIEFGVGEWFKNSLNGADTLGRQSKHDLLKPTPMNPIAAWMDMLHIGCGIEALSASKVE